MARLVAKSFGGRARIDFDGTRGYGSSFLEESFGGLIRNGYTANQVLSAFEFQAKDGSLIDEIKDYIEHGGDNE